MVNAFAYGDVALLEQFVVGLEVAVPVIDDGSGPRALPAVAIRPDGGVYDYTARYTAGSTEFATPAPLDAELAAEVARVALTAHEVLGLRDLSRSDLIVDADGPGVVPRGQRGARLHRDLDRAARPSRPPASTSARSAPPSSRPPWRGATTQE